MTDIIRAENAEISTAFLDWIRPKVEAGASLFVLEGLMDAGKSTLLDAFKSEYPGAYAISLDCLLADSETRPWLNAVQSSGGRELVGEALPKGLVLVEGGIAWPVVEALIEETGIVARRIYLQRWSARHGTPEWSDGEVERILSERSAEGISPSATIASIYAYHRDSRPWEAADLILQRLDDGRGRQA